MSHPETDSVALTSFQPPLADAVVSVLLEVGIPAWQAAERDEFDDVVVLVPADRRDEAMRIMGANMERIAGAAAASGAPSARGSGGAAASGRTSRAPAGAQQNPDDVRDGPPLTMERFADLRVVVIAMLAPLLVVTIAGPFLSRQARTITFIVVLIALGVFIARRRRRS